jgi:L-asparaginase II
LQRRIRDTVAEVCGVSPESLLLGVDGCSVCVFGAPLRAMARAYARFAAAKPGGDARERALDRIRRAMMQYPIATGGIRRFSSQVMVASGGTLVAKGGAEGLECMGVPELGLGIALKCEDGRSRAAGPAAVALLGHLGLLSGEALAQLEPWRQPLVRNAAGLVVGEIRARVVEALDAVTS